MTIIEGVFCVVILANIIFVLWNYLPRYKTPIERWIRGSVTEKKYVDSQIETDRIYRNKQREQKKTQRETYDEETENTPINLGIIASNNTHYCGMMLAEIYKELRRQGRQ